MKNIYQRIAEIQKACGYVKKDTTVGYGNNSYKATSHDAVLRVLRTEAINNGVIIVPSQQAKGESVAGQTKNGADKIRFEAVYDIHFINVDDPKDCHVMSVEAHGEDSNDKAPGKAISYATKTAMLKMFLLETGENDEARLDEGRPFEQVDYAQRLRGCVTLGALKNVFTQIPAKDKPKYEAIKDEMKAKLSQEAA